METKIKQECRDGHSLNVERSSVVSVCVSCVLLTTRTRSVSY